MLEINKTNYGYDIKSEEVNGPFEVRVIRPVHDPYYQLAIDAETGDCFIDLNKDQLVAIRDMLTKIIED